LERPEVLFSLNIDGLRIKVAKDVYPPSEDTYLLLDNLITAGRPLKLALDMGCGTGLISLKLASMAERVVAIDINPKAALNSQINARENLLDGRVDVICADLFTPLRKGVKFDLMTFNPPYLPVDDGRDELSLSWSGGKRGLRVVSRFLFQASRLLKEEGVILMVVSSLMDMKRLKRMASDQGFSIEVIKSEKVGLFEELHLLKLKRG